MSVDLTESKHVTITVTVETAEALASLLALVVDLTDNEGLQHLYEGLSAHSIPADATRVTFQDNPNFEEDDTDPINIVVASGSLDSHS